MPEMEELFVEKPWVKPLCTDITISKCDISNY